jgi:hypothetical protein
MARLQILELPQGSGDDRPPFVLVVDQYQPLRYVMAPGMEEQPVDEFEGVAEKIGARAVLVFWEPVEIPATEASAASDEQPDDSTVVSDLSRQLDEARNWARHGYEIGQRHCGWTDRGVAPSWLTEGWGPGYFGTCEHLKRATEYDEALTRVRNLPEQPDVMDAQHPEPNAYLHGYKVAIRDAKRATRNERAHTAEGRD